jgi:hypothetical protein
VCRFDDRVFVDSRWGLRKGVKGREKLENKTGHDKKSQKKLSLLVCAWRIAQQGEEVERAAAAKGLFTRHIQWHTKTLVFA